MKILIGNIFDSTKQTLVNTVNCVGVMGKGVALEFKKRYPAMYSEYVSLCEQKKLKPGKPYLYSDLTGTSILMFPTKDHWRSPSKMDYITDGLDWFAEHYKDLGIQSISFPPLGCGNGGLTWEMVGPIMYNKLKDLPIDIEIYAPYGTKKEELSIEYLANLGNQESKSLDGKAASKINDRWLLILAVIQRVNAGKHTLHVGRVIFQKICYILTRSGIKTNFVFSKATYGPYSSQVKEAVTALSNANLLTEKQLNNSELIEINVSPSFYLQQENYSEKELEAMESCVDLFCRIKSTDQAEMITTVIYQYDELVKDRKHTTEQDVLNGILHWKKHWTGDREEELKETIRDLAMLNWIHPIPSFFSDEYAV